MSAREAQIDRRADLCRRAAEALWRCPGATWVRELAPLTQAERAIATSHVRKMREVGE